MKLKHLTPLLIIVSTLFFVANAYAEWSKEKLFSNNKTEIYFDANKARYEGRKVYLWVLQNHINGHTNNGFRSVALYYELDCPARRYRNLSMKFYRANMGEGKPEFDDSTTSDWSYPRPDVISLGAFQTDLFCGVSNKLIEGGHIK